MCLLLTATLLLAPSCSVDTPQLDPDTLVTTRLAADSTDAAGSPGVSFTVDPDWDGINEYDFDGNPVITIPDSVPEGDAGEAV